MSAINYDDFLKRKEFLTNEMQKLGNELNALYKEEVDLLNKEIEELSPQRLFAFTDQKRNGLVAEIKLEHKVEWGFDKINVYYYPMRNNGTIAKRGEKLKEVNYELYGLSDLEKFKERLLEFVQPCDREIVNEFKEGNENLLKKHLHILVEEFCVKGFLEIAQDDDTKDFYLDFTPEFKEKYGVSSGWGQGGYLTYNYEDDYSSKTMTNVIWDCLSCDCWEYTDGLLDGMAKYYESVDLPREKEFLNNLLNKYIEYFIQINPTIDMSNLDLDER